MIEELENYLTLEDKLGDKYEKYLKLKEKFIKEGLPPNIAQYKASWVLTPEKLEKIKILAKNTEGLRIKLEIFVDNEDELKLLGKYFHFNPHVRQIKDGKLLIELLKLLEEINGK